MSVVTFWSTFWNATSWKAFGTRRVVDWSRTVVRIIEESAINVVTVVIWCFKLSLVDSWWFDWRRKRSVGWNRNAFAIWRHLFTTCRSVRSTRGNTTWTKELKSRRWCIRIGKCEIWVITHRWFSVFGALVVGLLQTIARLRVIWGFWSHAICVDALTTVGERSVVVVRTNVVDPIERRWETASRKVV